MQMQWTVIAEKLALPEEQNNGGLQMVKLYNVIWLESSHKPAGFTSINLSLFGCQFIHYAALLSNTLSHPGGADLSVSCKGHELAPKVVANYSIFSLHCHQKVKAMEKKFHISS